MVSRALRARLEALEAVHAPEARPEYIFVRVDDQTTRDDPDRPTDGADADRRALALERDLCGLGVWLGGQLVVPLPGESLDKLCMRAKALHWAGRVGVPCIMEAWTLEGLTTGTPDEPGPDAADLAIGVGVRLKPRPAAQPG